MTICDGYRRLSFLALVLSFPSSSSTSRQRLFAWRLMYIHIHRDAHSYIDYRSCCCSRGMREKEKSIFSILLLLPLSSVTRTAFLSFVEREKSIRREKSVILIDRSSPLFYLADHTWHNQIVLVSLDICISLISSRCYNESSRLTTQAGACLREKYPSANCISNFSPDPPSWKC